MKVTATVDYGSVEIEVTGDERTKVQEEIMDTIEFLRANEEKINALDGMKDYEESRQTKIETDDWESADSQSSGSDIENEYIKSVARDAGISAKKLNEIVHIDPDSEEPPHLMIEGDELGDSVKEQQLHGLYILVTAWESQSDEKSFPTSVLKDRLVAAGVSDSHLYRVWNEMAQGDFNAPSSGPKSSISFTSRGRRNAKKYLQKAAESV